MMFFGTARGNDIRGVTKVITKHYHFSDSRARELVSRRELVELRTMRCWLFKELLKL